MTSDDGRIRNIKNPNPVDEAEARNRLRGVAKKLGGSLENTVNPGWESTESTVEWVRSLRRESDAGANLLKDS